MNLVRSALACLTALSASFLISVCLLPARAGAQQFDSTLFADMHWRMIGPFRGGRALTAAGVPGQPSVFYFGAVGGGVWKTMDAGQVWTPIFDHEPVASIGAIAVAPSDPGVIYVGSGEADMRSDISYGNGVYKSIDAGNTWTHIGLEGTRQIGRILVDPRDPNVVFVAALGHAYGPNPDRGVFRSTDGGKTWLKALFKDENTGAIDLAFDPRDSRIIYAVLWQTRRPPWSVYPPSNGPGSGLYKSSDGGATWEHLTGHGLPPAGSSSGVSSDLGRIGIAVAPTDPDRVYLIVDAKEGGLYRSDNAGRDWRRMDAEQRIWGRGWYFGGISADPKDADIVYVANTSLYRSRDGGKSFDAFKGAPGGDDYHSLWISPDDPTRMILASDQGVIITADGGKTWSSWYNQPTAQFYHVITDSRFPYWVYGAQQDSGAAATTSLGHAGSISFRDWQPVGAGGENGYIAPDPLDPNILYGGSFGSAVARYDFSTGQSQDVAPALAHPGEYRRAWTLPLVFSPRDPHELYFGTQVLFRTMNGGQSWQIISPDLTRPEGGVLPNPDAPTAADVPPGEGKRRGVIYSIAPSPLRAGEIWLGTDDGLVQVSRDDGKIWHDVTPPDLTPWSKVGLIEASRYDARTVYLAVDRHRLDDLKPYIYRTRDGGATWQNITRGIPEGSYVNAVREDAVQKALLFAGTETGVFVSFNDGDEWQALQLNLPNASVRDLVIHQDDLVIATHGRSFWILDDITPLRQLQERGAEIAAAEAWLFRPAKALRVRPGSFEGTPLPPEVPQGENPPNGAIFDYYLKSAPRAPLALEVLDSAGKLVRRYSSGTKTPQVDARKLDIPISWIHPPKPLSAQPGMHRFVWDLRYPGAPGGESNPALALFGERGGPWAPPGQYTVKLTVNGHSYAQPLAVAIDPRVKTSLSDLMQQFEMAREIVGEQVQISRASAEAARVHQQLQALQGQVRHSKGVALRPVLEAIGALDRETETIAGAPPASRPDYSGVPTPTADRTSLRFLGGALSELERAVESADVAPSADARTAFQQAREAVEKTLDEWNGIKSQDLPTLNQSLQRAHLPPVSLDENKAEGPAAVPASTEDRR